jgi:hypothetical protein
MTDMTAFDEHLGLISRMSDALGADLGAALAEGRLAAGEWRAAVDRCRACGQERACARWLAAHPAGAPAAPDYCGNADLMGQLAAG